MLYIHQLTHFLENKKFITYFYKKMRFCHFLRNVEINTSEAIKVCENRKIGF